MISTKPRSGDGPEEQPEGMVLFAMLESWERVGRYIEEAPPWELFERGSSAPIVMDVMKEHIYFGRL